MIESDRALLQQWSLRADSAKPPSTPVTMALAPVIDAIVAAEQAVAEQEPQLAESEYRTALLEGWLLKGALEVEGGRLEEARAAFERAAASAALANTKLEVGKMGSPCSPSGVR
mgnify:CR=1 FL=1